jgi:lipoate-protein ligase B
VALNVAMDLSPFEAINPCGYAGLRTVDLSTIGVHVSAGKRPPPALGQAFRAGLYHLENIHDDS